MRGCAYHGIFGLIAGLACGTCCISSALAAMLGEKEACFMMAEKSGTAL